MTAAEVSPGAVAQRDLCVLHLARAGLAAQLMRRFDGKEKPAATRMIVGKCAAIQIDRQLSAELQRTALHERATLARLAEAHAFERGEDSDGEGVVDHAEVYVRRLEPCRGECRRP